LTSITTSASPGPARSTCSPLPERLPGKPELRAKTTRIWVSRGAGSSAIWSARQRRRRTLPRTNRPQPDPRTRRQDRCGSGRVPRTGFTQARPAAFKHPQLRHREPSQGARYPATRPRQISDLKRRSARRRLHRPQIPGHGRLRLAESREGTPVKVRVADLVRRPRRRPGMRRPGWRAARRVSSRARSRFDSSA